MWFKNLKIFTLTSPLSLDDDTFEQQLSEQIFRPCGNQDIASAGWVSPITGGASLFHAGDGRYLLSLKKQERVLPAAVVNAELEERVQKIEADTGAPVSKKAKQDLKQEITQEFLPKAFTRDSYTFGFISPKDNLVIVDSSSDGKVEAFLATLRKCLGSLPVVPLARRSLSADLTLWLSQDQTPADIELLEEAEFKSPDEDGAVIRCKNQPLDTDEIRLHLDAGKLVQKLAIEWDETLSAIVQEDLAIKRLKFTDVIKDQNDDIPKDEQAARLDADFCLMSAEVIRFVQALDKAFELSED
ncbi:Recombination-associated protein RdgC [Saliniradius amylolyticus]|uniref:Recombination-associated protein RdgC n=1 Tax=Saliniradius amylolyticus TaxID=2183582 RepID=A0A2S2E0F9_9ALTE|nr:recombination-associated protein RdgC [Saliniradius amylolyticus]AWL11103.1 Recombination-associated protein RdgC [Saliniradius amylolyticus]